MTLSFVFLSPGKTFGAKVFVLGWCLWPRELLWNGSGSESRRQSGAQASTGGPHAAREGRNSCLQLSHGPYWRIRVHEGQARGPMKWKDDDPKNGDSDHLAI